jgi:hypothetical protein
MALVIIDRAKETTTTTGTGSVTLLGAVTGFQSLAGVGNTNTTYYCIADQTGANWEVGLGTYSTTGPTLARTTVIASSNAGAAVTFTAGTKDVFVTYPAENAVYSSGTTLVAPSTAILPVANGGTGAATLTLNNVLLGNGTSAPQVVAPSTSGNVLTSNGTTWTSVAGYAGFNTVLFAASGTWTVPTGITKARVTVVGGGSGGFTSATTAAGGSGGFAQAYITGLSGSVTVTVGLGSNEATSGSSTAGGTTSFGAFISATGGGAASSGSAGASGTGTVTTGTALRTGSISASNSGLFTLGGIAAGTVGTTTAIVWSTSSTFIPGKPGSTNVGGGASVGGLVIIEY